MKVTQMPPVHAPHVKACSLTASSHYLNIYWLIISGFSVAHAWEQFHTWFTMHIWKQGYPRLNKNNVINMNRERKMTPKNKKLGVIMTPSFLFLGVNIKSLGSQWPQAFIFLDLCIILCANRNPVSQVVLQKINPWHKLENFTLRIIATSLRSQCVNAS